MTEVEEPLVDPDKLTAYAARQLPGEGPLQVERLAEGHSNLTFTVTRAGTDAAWILRRPPRGPLLPTAHDVMREATVLQVLAGTGAQVRIPTVALACADESVLGVPFYLMQRTPGVVIREVLPDWLAESQRAGLTFDLVDALVELHAVPTDPLIEAGIGRPGGYVERQIRRWVGQREGVQAVVAASGSTARELRDYDVVRDWLRERLTGLPEQSTAVVHGDYKFDNVIVDPASARVAVIVDWEMATVGDPLADVGYLLSFFPEHEDALSERLGGNVVSAPGFPSRDEIVGRYADVSGRQLSDITFYEVLAVWKLAILLEASYYRFLAGTTDDPFFAELEQGVPALLARARRLAGV